MSVLIKGSIMPLMCEECPCCDCDDYSCKATGRGVIEYRYDGRPDNCPLVEIPTPHGRLIDADELKKNMRNYYPSIDHLCCSQHVVTKRDIDCAPTIIEAEVSE